MKISFYVDNKEQDKKIEKVIKNEYKTIPMSIIFKLLRKGNILVNSQKAKLGQVVVLGDLIEFDIEEKFLEHSKKVIEIIFEDDNLLIIDKPFGIPSHPDNNDEYSVVDWINDRYRSKSDFIPALCHRLDRNTGGLLIIAKNRQSLSEMLKYFSDKKIQKKYLALTKSSDIKKQDKLVSYLYKDQKNNKVFISDKQQKGFSKIITKYKIINKIEDLFLVEAEIITGKTHQIRAHLAHIGIPIIGDDKYGDWKLNKKYKAEYQCLYAYYIHFNFEKRGLLQYLSNAKFVRNIVTFPIEDEKFKCFNISELRGI
ncbi:RluA family pseudouridine synthase [Caldicellulosiruptoraceae bacterium PP1]